MSRQAKYPSVRAMVGFALTRPMGLVFVLILGGRFRMGAVTFSGNSGTNIDPGARPSEGPVHEVHLQPFFLSKFEMTQGQWLRATGQNPSRHGSLLGKEPSLLHPVENVDWNTCDGVLGRLGLLLPTEAQWEYATRAGTGTVWWTGSDSASLEGGANLAGPSEAKIAADEWEPNEGWPDDGHLYHAPVGTFAANPFGLHDVSGNVWEWCRDWAGSYDLPVEHGDGERKIDSSRARDRLMRGGSFYGGPRYARSARRSETAGSIAVDNLGVRPACKIIAE